MSGVKADLAGATLSAETAGKPAANAGRNEPSIDEILASIRQVISEQNRQADEAAAKAAAEVANSQEKPAKVETIIGPVSSGHIPTNSASKPTVGTVKAPEIVVSDKVDVKAEPLQATAEMPAVKEKISTHPTELEELIHLIGAAPAVPRPRKTQAAIAPHLDAAVKTRPVQASEEKTVAPVAQAVPSAAESVKKKQPPLSFYKVFRRGDKASNTKSAVVLPTESTAEGNAGRENIAGESFKPAATAHQLHPSISPKSEVPQVIKDAMGQLENDLVGQLTAEIANPDDPISPAAPAPAAEMKQSAPDAPAKPVVSHKSALDRLLARKSAVAPKPAVQVKSAPAAKPAMAARPVAQVQTPPIQPKQRPVSAAPVTPINTPTPMQSQSSQNGEQSARPVVSAASAGAPISSREINAAVIKSIDRLATSMFADRKAEIDGMMAGMMRPMLQEWLEDNLSSLVERIVREEIERVSRGVH